MLKIEKVRATFRKFLKLFWDFWFLIFRKIVIEICMKMKIFEIENFRKFSISKISKIFIENCMKMKNIWDRKFSKIFDLKKNNRPIF